MMPALAAAGKNTRSVVGCDVGPAREPVPHTLIGEEGDMIVHSPWVLSLLSSFLIFLGLRGIAGGLTIWVAFVPFFYLLDRVRTSRKAFFYSFLTGFFLYLQSAIWLTQVTFVGYLLLCFVLSLYFGFFGWIYYKIIEYALRTQQGRVKNLSRILFISCLWIFLEYLRCQGPFGFPWFLVGSSLYSHLELIQIASIGGVYILSFAVIWFNQAIYEVIVLFVIASRRRSPSTSSGSRVKSRDNLIHGIATVPFDKLRVPRNDDRIAVWRNLIISLLFIGLLYIYGFFRLEKKNDLQSSQELKIALIQGNILQEEKWDPVQAENNLYKYEKLSIKAAREKPDLIVWPETALPTDLEKDRYLKTRVKNLALKTRAFLLLGGNDDRLDTEGTIHNSAFLIDPNGEVITQYDKIHLVPYGEYVPFRKWFPWVGNFTIGEVDFSRGKHYKVFNIEGKALSVVICFEDALAHHIRKFVKEGAQYLVNLTNDAWFGDSPAAREHLRLASFAALANGVGLARATNTGISAFVSPYGEVIDKVHHEGQDMEVEGFAIHKVTIKRIGTFYQKYGDVFAWGCGVVSIIFGIWNLFIGILKRRNS